MSITIFSPDQKTRAIFLPERGGTLSSLLMPNAGGDPQERLYRHNFFDQHPWTHFPGGAPFCFPICGRAERGGVAGKYFYDGKMYSMGIHGFAWQMPWKVEDLTKHSLTMVLENNAETLQQYPFLFRVELLYELQDRKLTCWQTYQNAGKNAMPYAAGFHPYFLTPPVGAGKEKVLLDYKPVRRFVYNKTLTDLVGEQTLFSLPTAVTNPDINEQLTKVGENKKIILEFPSGEALYMEAAGMEDTDLFSYVQLYTMPDRPFICVEPWMSFPNAINTVQGMRWLQPQQAEHGKLEISILHKNT